MPSKLSKITADVVVSHLLLYLVLACYFALFYACVILILLALGLLPFGDHDLPFFTPWWVNVVTIVAIAPTLLPLHRWLRSRINEIVYGEHDDPYALISVINAQLLAMSSAQMTLPTVAVTIARTLHLPYVALTIDNDADNGLSPSRYEVGAQAPHTEVTTLPLLYLGKSLGEVTVGARHAHESLSESDREVLGAVAQQVAIALHVEQLSADLQASRERLVIGREEERRRIRNDLHDGLGPTLSSLQLQLGTLRNLIRQQPDKAEAIATDLRDDLRQATAEIRQLVYDLRPPLLDELGLVEAIKSLCAEGSPFTLAVNAPEAMPKMAAALEVAIYRIASEAIHNVMRHAQATRCTVELAVDEGTLKMAVCDNGVGLPSKLSAGVGITSMKERAAELGGTLTILPGAQGGTEVLAYFPLAVQEAHE